MPQISDQCIFCTGFFCVLQNNRNRFDVTVKNHGGQDNAVRFCIISEQRQKNAVEIGSCRVRQLFGTVQNRLLQLPTAFGRGAFGIGQFCPFGRFEKTFEFCYGSATEIVESAHRQHQIFTDNRFAFCNRIRRCAEFRERFENAFGIHGRGHGGLRNVTGDGHGPFAVCKRQNNRFVLGHSDRHRKRNFARQSSEWFDLFCERFVFVTANAEHFAVDVQGIITVCKTAPAECLGQTFDFAIGRSSVFVKERAESFCDLVYILRRFHATFDFEGCNAHVGKFRYMACERQIFERERIIGYFPLIGQSAGLGTFPAISAPSAHQR